MTSVVIILLENDLKHIIVGHNMLTSITMKNNKEMKNSVQGVPQSQAAANPRHQKTQSNA